MKIHVKEYNLNVATDEGMRNDFPFPLGQGSINWEAVRKELTKLGYLGWAIAEVNGGDRRRSAEVSQQSDHVHDLHIWKQRLAT
jgi:L-ribulose-5-phosphate 3-epimerase